MLKKINFISLDREEERVYICKKYLNPKLMKTQNPNLEETEFIAQLEAEIAEWFNNINDLFDKAYLEYEPMVKEICTRTAPEDEVDNLLTWLLDFCEDERFLTLSKKICRNYYEIYPELVSFYTKEYMDIFELEEMECTVYDYLFKDDDKANDSQ